MVYDSMNRETYATHNEPTGSTADFFDYNLAGQITAAQYGTRLVSGHWVNPTRTVSYVWDNAGNRTSVADTVAGTKAYTPNILNQYSAVGADNTDNGTLINNIQHELSTYRGISYGYYGDGYLASVSGVGNVYVLYYDALGRCVKRTLTAGGDSTTKYYLFDGEHWIVEYNSDGATISNVTYGLGIDEIIARGVDGHGQFPLPDRNGNTSVVTGPQSEVMESYHYDAFGAPTIRNPAGQVIPSSAATVKNRFLFTGREYNSQFGFYEYRARAYHPGLGRFMSEDPKGFDAGDYYLYRYCGNDPWDRTDPMGLEPPYSPAGTIDVMPDVLAGGFASARQTQTLSNQSGLTLSGIHFEYRVDGFRNANHALVATTPVQGHQVPGGQRTEASEQARNMAANNTNTHAYIAHNHPDGLQPGHDLGDKRAANDVHAGNYPTKGANPVPSSLANGQNPAIEIYVPSSNQDVRTHVEGGITLRSTDGKTMTDGKTTYPLPTPPPQRTN